MSQQLQITGGAKVRDLQDVIIGTSGVLSSLAFNVANGVPKLDVNGKILVSQLPNSVMEYLGTWDASTNTPTLVNGTGNQGDVYLCNVAGTTNFGAGPITFAVGDSAIYSGTIWQKAGGATGTVTSVGLTSTGNDAITITGSPITTSGNINLGFAGTNLQYINGAGDLTTFPTLISSIGLSMPSAFSVANSPLTSNGTIAVTGAGYPSQYIRGDGTLADFPTSGGGGSSVSYYLNGGTSQGVIGGVTYYEMSKTADTGTGVDFTKSGDGFIVAFLTDAGDPAQLNIPAGNWNYEIYASMSANGGTPEMYAELYKYDGTTFTLISTSSNEILYDGTNLNLYTFAMTVPSTTLAITDRLAIKLYATNSGGKTTTVHTQDSHLCQVITTFSTGITALNGLTAQVQYFATGTSGTDFNISSTTATHTFNIPSASATNRGLITTGTQTIAGGKTFTSLVNLNQGALIDSGYALSWSPNEYVEGSSVSNSLKFATSGLYRLELNSTGIFRLNAYTTNGLLKTTSSNGTFAIATPSTDYVIPSDLSSYVPYTGATQGLDIGSNSITTNNFYYGRGIILDAGIEEVGGSVIFRQRPSISGPATNYTTIGAVANNILSFSFWQDAPSGVNRYKFFSFRVDNITIGTNRTYQMPNADGTLALTSDLGSYLPLAGGIMTGSILLNNNLTISGQLFGTSSYASMLAMSPSDKVLIDNSGRGVIFGGTIGQGAYTYTFPSASGTLALTSNITSAISGTTNYHAKFTGTNTIGNSLIWDNGTNVGIGNTNTSYTLDVTGTGRFTGALTGSSATFTSATIPAMNGPITLTGNANSSARFIITGTDGNGASFFLNSLSTNGRNWGIYSNGIAGVGELAFYNQTNNITALTILPTGNVGIGSSSPSSNINSTANVLVIKGTTTFPSLVLQGTNSSEAGFTSADELYIDVAGNATASKNAIIFRNTNTNSSYSVTERMRITSGGGVVIGGTANPRDAYLTLGKTNGGGEALNCYGWGNGYGYGIWMQPHSSASGTHYPMSFRNPANTEVGYISSNSSNTVFSTSGSDFRLKNNIEDWDEEVLPYFSNIKPKTFFFNTDEEGMPKSKGYIAQDNIDKFPEAYPINADGFYTFNPDGMVVYLMKAIQEMNTKLDEQNQTIQNLQEQINILAK